MLPVVEAVGRRQHPPADRPLEPVGGWGVRLVEEAAARARQRVRRVAHRLIVDARDPTDGFLQRVPHGEAGPVAATKVIHRGDEVEQPCPPVGE